MINDMRRLSLMCVSLPDLSLSPDPDDDFLLAVSQSGRADYLVTGDKSGLLGLDRYGRTRIVTARFLAGILEK